MFIVLLRFSKKKDLAGAFVDDHKAWLKQGFDDGAFLLAGRLRPAQGGGILVDCGARAEVEALVAQDPYVREDVVKPEIIEIAASMADPRLSFLVSA